MQMEKTASVLIALLTVGLLSCATGAPESQPPDPGAETPDLSQLGSPVNLTFEFSNRIDSSNVDFDSEVIYPTPYTVPLYIRENGLVSLRAADFPRMVFRICSQSSPATGCNKRLNGSIQIQGTGVQEAVDLVLDTCGLGRLDADCGDADPTVFTGSLSDDGTLALNGIVMRVRVFLVKAASDGIRADDTDTGLLELARIPVRVTTGSVSAGAGALSGSGSAVNGLDVTLAAAGTVPASMPELGGAHYLATLVGQFDVDPLAVLE